jgi:hypothetical protein
MMRPKPLLKAIMKKGKKVITVKPQEPQRGTSYPSLCEYQKGLDPCFSAFLTF